MTMGAISGRLSYLPSEPDPNQLQALVWTWFNAVPRTETHFTNALLGHNAIECAASDALDMAHATLADINALYESNTGYSAEGYKYRFPRMFDLVNRMGAEAFQTDFVDAYFRVNICVERPCGFTSYSIEQKYCVWLVYDCLDRHFGRSYLFDHDALDINQSNGWPEDRLEVVDVEAVAYLSRNLFGEPEPPMDEIRSFWAAAEVASSGAGQYGPSL